MKPLLPAFRFHAIALEIPAQWRPQVYRQLYTLNLDYNLWKRWLAAHPEHRATIDPLGRAHETTWHDPNSRFAGLSSQTYRGVAIAKSIATHRRIDRSKAQREAVYHQKKSRH